MKISEIMTRTVETVSADATIEQAARKMRSRSVGILPVIEESKLIGTVTDRDITVRAVAEGRTPHLTVVRDVMSPHALCIFEDQSLMEASRMMQRNHIRLMQKFRKADEFRSPILANTRFV